MKASQTAAPMAKRSPAGNRDGVTNPSISPAGPTSSTG